MSLQFSNICGRILALVCTIPAILAVPDDANADDLVLLPVNQVMMSSDAQQKLDGSVEFFFGDTPHPSVSQDFGNFVTNQKTNGFFKDDTVACTRVAVSALIRLQERAKSLGGDAVINIASYFKKNLAVHDAQIECYKGFVLAGVALKGDVVKLAGN